LEAAAGQIESDKLHILVHTDIGMNPITLQLAALRLAPIQCKGWGHPVTTGLPTVDYYLSSDLMEPEDADRHYSETLVRLPNLALCFTPPQLPLAPKSRKELGIDPDRFIYLTTQSIFKYLPQHDDIYPKIARAIPHASFVFLANQSQAATKKFFDRLRMAFRAYGLNADQYCRFSPRLTLMDFYSLNLAADVLLDTFDWSGGKTTLEAIGCGLPVITCPGRFMRGRHAYAMLKMMGITSTIASDKSSYCQLAIRMAADKVFYTGVKNEFLRRRNKVFSDRTIGRALEDFYRSAVQKQLEAGYANESR
jgi:protein O-GlcNAc transferase